MELKPIAPSRPGHLAVWLGLDIQTTTPTIMIAYARRLTGTMI
jgi:hypothetical protein